MGKTRTVKDDFLSLTPKDFAEPERKKPYSKQEAKAVLKILKDFGITATIPTEVVTYGQLHTWKMNLIRAK